MYTNETAMNNRSIESGIASDLNKHLKKILHHCSKDLELYLQSAEAPAAAAKLFTQDEIENFIDKQKMLPLEKLVVLSGIMGKCLTLKFTGKRTASLPLQFTGSPDDFLAQMHFNIYSVMALIGDKSDAFEQGEEEPELTGESVNLESLDALVDAASYRGFSVRVVMQSQKSN